ncbi:hypothetical protein BGW37DRAFT_520390 [Umbelopsis sp. PMI_123]|nr:hypothetical protein BGW37DRAFT_520390 [Umbelopsis sp. PMI_123]
MHYKKTGEKMIPASTWIGRKDLTGYTVVVTGANSGLGFITSCVFACLGANVHIGVRTKAKGDETLKQILAYVSEHDPDKAPNAEKRLFAHYVEMSDFASVRAFCQDFQQPIDILINNAGLQSNQKQTTKDGYEMTWQVNYLSSTFLTTKLLLPLLEQAGKERGKRAKVINITSGMHKMKAAYTKSKLAQVLNIEYYTKVELPPSTSPTSPLFYGIIPGPVQTNLYRQENGFDQPPWSGFADRPSPDEAAYPIFVCALEDYAAPGSLLAVPDGREDTKSDLALDMNLTKSLWSYSINATG